MPWTKGAKLRFYHRRRSAYIKTLKSVGLSGKEAVKVANREMKKEYALRKKGYAEVDRLEKMIMIAKDKGRSTKRLEAKQQRILEKTASRWTNFESKIGYIDPSEIDEKRIRGIS